MLMAIEFQGSLVETFSVLCRNLFSILWKYFLFGRKIFCDLVEELYYFEIRNFNSVNELVKWKKVRIYDTLAKVQGMKKIPLVEKYSLF